MKASTVVLDLDGTLLNGEKRVSERNVSAVLRCLSRGMRVIFATARPPRSVKWFLPEGLLELGAFVYYNGALVSCNETGVEWHEVIPAAVTADILHYCLARDAEVELTMEVRDEWFSLREREYAGMMKAEANPIVKSLEELTRCDATKILISGAELSQELFETFGHLTNILVTDNRQLIQIMPLQASKELAVTRLCEHYGVALDSVIAFGDDFNDLGLFRCVGHAVAMGNAIRELKEAADEITGTNEEDGVAQVLERLCPERVFVYGTLRRGECNHGELEGARLISGSASLKGKLYDTGFGYPAMRLSTTGKVYGELYEIDGDTLSRLDALEDYYGLDDARNLYDRVWLIIDTDEGAVEAWTYVYAEHQPIDEQLWIEQGDWKRYRAKENGGR